MGCNFVSMIILSFGMLDTNPYIKQNITFRLLVYRNNSKQNYGNTNELLKSIHLVMSIIHYLQSKGAFLKINISLLNK